VRFLSPDDWLPREVLLSVVQLTANGEDTDEIVTHLAQMLVDHGIPLEWLVGVTANGAKVNFGKLSGVIRRLWEKVQHIHLHLCDDHAFAV
jgi:hypothetical protein